MAISSYLTPRAASSPYWNPYLETLPREQLDALHLKKLKAVMGYAYQHSPFYRRRFDEAGLHPDDIKTLDDFKRRVPLTDKPDFIGLQDERPHYGDTGAAPAELLHHHCETSGTTGSPLRIPLTIYDTERYGEAWCYGWWGIGMRPGTSFYFAFNWGLFAGFWSAYWGLRRFGGKLLSGGGQTSEGHIRLMQRLRPDVLMATPTYALRLADVARGMGVDPASIGLKWTYVSGEPGPNAIPAMRTQLEDSWGAPTGELLGAAELHAFAPGCPLGQGVHVDEPSVFVWVRDPETGEEVPEGGIGETVVTSYANQAQPLINYRTHDLVQAYRSCDCGRSWLYFKGVILGRSDFMIKVRGTGVYQSAVQNLLGSVNGVSNHYQLILTREGGMDQMTVQAEPQPGVPEDGYPELIRRVEQRLHQALGVHLRVELVPPETLPRYELKTRRIVDQRPKEVRMALER